MKLGERTFGTPRGRAAIIQATLQVSYVKWFNFRNVCKTP